MAQRLGDFMVQAWKRESFVIALDTNVVRVDGIVLAEMPDIGLHIAQSGRIDCTHIPSGKRIGNGFETIGAAMEFVHRVAYIRDWHAVLSPEEYTVLQHTYAHVVSTERRPEAVLL